MTPRSDRFVICCLCIVTACSILSPAEAESDVSRPTQFECRFTNTPVVIDGKADDAAWQYAEVIDNFGPPWQNEESDKTRAPTKARLLWDRTHLYFFAEMQDIDLFANVQEHDGQTWDNDAFELLFKPAANTPGYFDFQITAAGTVMDCFVPKRSPDGISQHLADDEFHLEVRAVTDGTLNIRSDTDNGWAIEGRIPWTDFIKAGGRPAINEVWSMALCRHNHSINKDAPELTTCAPLQSNDIPRFHNAEDFADLKFIGPQRHDLSSLSEPPERDRLTLLKDNWQHVPSRVTGSPEPPPAYVTKRTLPDLTISLPIYALREPTGRRLYYLHQETSGAASRLVRTTDNPASGESEVVYELPNRGIAYSAVFHPNYADNGYVYIGWNDRAPKQEGVNRARSIITRLTISPQTGDVDPTSAQEIISWPSDGHNGAAVAFGSDGMLYITSGDGTADSDINLAGQKLDNLLAKVLRIDVDHPSDDRPYSVPIDNPFVDHESARPETWAYGLRNPWRMTADPLTGDLWVGNNGQDLWEQVYLVQRGDNFGWSVYEGGHVFYANRSLGPTPHVKPIFDHSHSESRSLTGGVVYYGTELPKLQGAYIYGDYSTGKIWAAKVKDGAVEWHKEIADTNLQIVAFATDADDELLIVDYRQNGGGFHTLVPNTVHANANPDLFPQKLSDSGLYASVVDDEVHPGVIPYSVNSPLWSDGAFKTRFLFLPSNSATANGEVPTQINFKTNGNWDFPDGTVIIKSFGFELREGDANSLHRLETRFLTRQNGEWVGYAYAWNDKQTDATLVEKEGRDLVLDVVSADGKATQQKWRIPGRTECMVCHSRAANFVLGLSSLQLNKNHNYGGTTVNQLEVFEWLELLNVNWKSDSDKAIRRELSDAGYATKAIDQRLAAQETADGQRPTQKSSLLARPAQHYDRLLNPYDEAGDVTKRVRSYLHANCAQCHVSAGGGNAKLQLDYATPLNQTMMVDEVPLHHQFGKDDPRIIAPGEPDRSVLLHRISFRGRGQMPQLATNIVDVRAVELFTQWIKQLETQSVR